MKFRVERIEEVAIAIGGIPRNTRVQIYATPGVSLDYSELTPDHITFQTSHEVARKIHVGDEIEISIKIPIKAKIEEPVNA